MKRLLLLAFVITVTNLYAQEFQPDINKLIAHSKVSSFKKDTSKTTPRQPLALDLKLLTPRVLKLQPDTHALPQDGMPCIVPDTKSIAAIPNAAKDDQTPPVNRIPNAASEQRFLSKPKEWSK